MRLSCVAKPTDGSSYRLPRAVAKAAAREETNGWVLSYRRVPRAVAKAAARQARAVAKAAVILCETPWKQLGAFACSGSGGRPPTGTQRGSEYEMRLNASMDHSIPSASEVVTNVGSGRFREHCWLTSSSFLLLEEPNNTTSAQVNPCGSRVLTAASRRAVDRSPRLLARCATERDKFIIQS